MGSATRESLATAEAALSAAKTVTIQTGEQLLSAGRIIGGSAQLRSVLSDPDAEHKGQLVRSIFGSLDDTASSLLVGMAESRWSSTDQFLDAVEEIGIRAVARASGDDGAIESELFAFAKAIESDAELELALGSKLGEPQGRVELVDTLLSGRASEGTIVLLRYVVQGQRGRRIGELISRVADIAAHDADAIVVTLTAATKPTAKQLERLRTSLATRYGRTPRFDVTVDPELVGGLRVQVGDEVIDGSVANRLADLRLRLAG